MDPARSLASGYRFVGSNEDAGVPPALTGSDGTPVAALDPTAQIEPAMSSQTVSREI